MKLENLSTHQVEKNQLGALYGGGQLSRGLGWLIGYVGGWIDNVGSHNTHYDPIK